MTWLMDILKIELEEQFLLKYFVMKHLILPKIQNMMDIRGVLLRFLINLLIKKFLVVLLKLKICQTENYLNNYTSQLLENLKNEKYIHFS